MQGFRHPSKRYSLTVSSLETVISLEKATKTCVYIYIYIFVYLYIYIIYYISYIIYYIYMSSVPCWSLHGQSRLLRRILQLLMDGGSRAHDASRFIGGYLSLRAIHLSL